MTAFVRIVLLTVSFSTFLYVVRKVRKSQFQIEDSIFWVCFFLFTLTLGVFPQIGVLISNLIGFDSPANFVFLTIMFVLLVKTFFQSIRISQLDNKIRILSQQIALDRHEYFNSNENEVE